MYADISNFTAWSTVREPGQVFILLETIYGAFDSVAKRRGVYKVETIGDSYVAVAGLPDRRADHAIVMARFARDCRQMMSYMMRDLVSPTAHMQYVLFQVSTTRICHSELTTRLFSILSLWHPIQRNEYRR